MRDSSSLKRVRKPATKLDPNWRIQWGLHREFPLFPHQSGRWAKKVRGSLHYFGKVADDPKGVAASKLWAEQKDQLIAGLKPKGSRGALTVKDVVNIFLNDKRQQVELNEIKQGTFDEYRSTGEFVAEHFCGHRVVEDLDEDDFKKLRTALAKRFGPVRLGNEIQRVRMVFNHCQTKLTKPVQFGKQFRKPPAKVLRIARAERGPRDIPANEIRALIEKASPNMRAMILLGINAALGPTDLGLLKLSVLDLEGGWLRYPRPKTGIDRKIPLWPETVAEIREAIIARRQPTEEANAVFVFISPQGKSYYRKRTGKDGRERGERADAVCHEFKKVREAAKLTGRTFYDLRRTFQTIAEEACDLSAVQSIMGHAAGADDMSARYRQRVSDERLLAVAEHVRKWLFPKTAQTYSTKSAG